MATQLYSLKLLLLLVACFAACIRAEAQFTNPGCDNDLLQFAMNLEFLEAEFFLHGAFGEGLDTFAPELTGGGPPPIGVQRAPLHWLVRDVIVQFGFQEVGHLRAIQQSVDPIPRPMMDLSVTHFAKLMDMVIGTPLDPPFDPYRNDINFLLGSYILPYIALTGYVGSNQYLNGTNTKRLLAGLLAVESGQDAVIRAMLYERALQHVHPYPLNVAEFTQKISTFRDQLSLSLIDKDDGVVTQKPERNQGTSQGNIINGDWNSIAFSRTPQEILRIVYETGSETSPGGFFPFGANGNIARAYLDPSWDASFACLIPPGL
ncbi:hypothetical protein Scep_020853 [Stephania cephalantha]|uniref:Desiccation-related protein PCC13-62 n=1 Tax=Stephania cephalantha TaxID=152367 RepID=A0AAP0I1C7_9MAGN